MTIPIPPRSLFRIVWTRSLGVALTLLVASLSYAQTFTVLHEFAGFPNDGRMPTAPLIEDSAGNLYGTAYAAGKFGGGIVFKLNPNGHETVLHNFSSGSYGARGANAYGLVRDAAGNLYGTTFEGGDLSCNPGHGCGTVFKLDTSNRLTVLHAFHWTDGSGPNSGLILAADGTLYGTTAGGGNGPTGTVFTVDTVTGHLTLLKSFPSSFGGPTGSIAIDAAGNLYGATYFGGGPSCTCGTVFELEAGAGFTVMWEGKDGMTPLGGVTLGSDGNLYFTTSGFGDACSHTCGAVFRLNPATYQATMLYSFTGLADGAYPAAGLALDSEGNLYGTTAFGGKTTTPGGGYGVVFKIDTTGKETVLHTFDGTDGAQPQASLLLDSAGNLYGTTAYGGSSACKGGCGVVFKIAP